MDMIIPQMKKPSGLPKATGVAELVLGWRFSDPALLL